MDWYYFKQLFYSEWRIKMLKSDNTLALVIDIQERLIPVLHEANHFLAKSRQLLQGLNALNVPVLVTEQYPKGLGKTVADIALLTQDAPIFEKTQFSAWTEEVRMTVEARAPQNIILLGCETHICMLQTVWALREQGYQVFVAQECVTSRTLANKENGLQQMQTAGAVISNIETLLFQILGDAKHPAFKEISKLIQ